MFWTCRRALFFIVCIVLVVWLVVFVNNANIGLTKADEAPSIVIKSAPYEVTPKLPISLQYVASPITKRADQIYSFVITPRPEHRCDQFRPSVCSNATFFEVLVQGPDGIKLSGFVSNVDNQSQWQVDIEVPIDLSGNYTIEVKIVFQDYPQIFQSLPPKSEFYQQLPQVRERFPAKILFEKLNLQDLSFFVSNTNANDHLAARQVLPWCSDIAPSPELHGYWDEKLVNFFPFRCRLKSVRSNAVEGRNSKHELIEGLHGAWLAMFGDCNTRSMFEHLCFVLGGLRVVLDRNVGGFCVSADLVISFHFWWPSTNEQLSVKFSFSDHLQLLLGANKSAMASVLQTSLVDLHQLTEPTLSVVSAGSHDFFRINEQGNLAKKMLQRDTSQTVTDMCLRLLFLSVTPVNPTLTQKERNLPHKDLIFLSENNMRVQQINHAMQQTFPSPGCHHIDLFSVALVPYLTRIVEDRLHFHLRFHEVFVDLILNYVYHIRKA